MGGLGVGVIVLLFYWRLNVFKKREEKKTALNKKIAEVELLALRSQMNPHFTFNVLNSIQYYIGKSDTDSAQRYITKFARLVRMILNQSRDTYITLEDKLRFLNTYLELETMRFENKFSYRIEVDPHLESEKIKMPGMLIQPLVENAIKHGIEHKKGDAVIHISFTTMDSKQICTVKDNGIGRAEAAKLKEGQPSYQSMATSILRERINTLQSLHNITLGYRIEDISENGQATGTAVSIEIPMNLS
jgi:sensor histidine kinase YesM